MHDAEVVRSEGLIYVVLEYGETDLAHLLAKRERTRAGGAAAGTDDNFLRDLFEQMVEAVRTIHAEQIVHSDLKPANFLVVEGVLKLIDFGIARSFAKAQQSDATNIVREHQVGTLNYMSPEAILNGQTCALSAAPLKVGRASDIWSLGCILYQMVYKKTPFSHITRAPPPPPPYPSLEPPSLHSPPRRRAETIPKLHAITDPNQPIAFPPLDNEDLRDLMQAMLQRCAAAPSPY